MAQRFFENGRIQAGLTPVDVDYIINFNEVLFNTDLNKIFMSDRNPTASQMVEPIVKDYVRHGR